MQLGLWRYVLITLALLRLLFIPFFFLCNVDLPRSGRFPVIFANDAWPIAGVTAFGLSNGFLATMALISAPEYVCTTVNASVDIHTVLSMSIMDLVCFVQVCAKGAKRNSLCNHSVVHVSGPADGLWPLLSLVTNCVMKSDESYYFFLCHCVLYELYWKNNQNGCNYIHTIMSLIKS